MPYTSITYRRKFNIGNYESEDIEVTYQVDEGDEEPLELIKKVKGDVLLMFRAQSRVCPHSRTLGSTSGLLCQDCGEIIEPADKEVEDLPF